MMLLLLSTGSSSNRSATGQIASVSWLLWFGSSHHEVDNSVTTLELVEFGFRFVGALGWPSLCQLSGQRE